ncbi:tyrosine-type recombinase/integrase [Granulicella sibirica]|uniref:Site-specific recombinase, phage integrase family n=1 Tax=Granulicella sibirica TaxID=2479048 RepID=A0A4Q0T541_9BACT|nr:phage integrase SAM-like domain-containing protein [Granulicella sibirica]RXH56726.1 Site-specific recombinase, phage integrase family [Granulicella sibirica]
MSEHHTILGGKVHVYRRPNSSSWQCATYLAGKNRRTTTKEDSLSKAKEFAEDWYLQLRGKLRDGNLKSGKPFREAAKLYLREFGIMTQGQRNATYARGKHARTNGHLVPFFGSMVLPEITAGKINEYRIHRLEEAKENRGKPPAHSTMHQEIVTLRQIFKTALRHGWIDYLPYMSAPYRASAKISHRAWFSPEEYKKLYEATRKRAQHPKQPRFRWEAEQLHDYVLFSANTGLRPDEAMRLQFRNVKVVEDEGSGQTILEIEVRGKRGIGFCKSTVGAVRPFERLENRLRPHGGPGRAGSRKNSLESGEWQKPEPTDLLFPKWSRDLFNKILDEEKLRKDRDERPRTAYSLRHTYICLRLLEGADIYQIAKNCRTSVEMIEKYYAAHLKTQLDASAINVMKPRLKNDSAKKKGSAKRGLAE